MKVCNICKESKPLVEFSKSKATKVGLQPKCKECTKEYNNQYYQDNKEALAKYDKQYREDNREYWKQYTQDNKEALAQYRQDNKESRAKYDKQLAISEGYGVYKITHLPTQYFYIGEGQIHDRRNNHFNKLQRGENKCGLLQEHYNKHPNIDEWQFEVIYKFKDYDKEAGLELEAFIIEESREKYPTQVLNKK